MTEYLTAQLPGIGGVIRSRPEDFVVDELPLYEPCGAGSHLYLRVEKRGLTTFDLLREVAAALGCRERELGYAGLKDARALTRQTISVPGATPADVDKLRIEGVKILSAQAHRNRLRPGHLAGNRFSIRIREVATDAAERAASILAVLEHLGVPNRFGRQRYGALGNSHRVGRAILRGEFEQAVSEVIGAPEQIEHSGWRAAAEAFHGGQLTAAMRLLPRHCRHERRLLEMLHTGKGPRQALLAMPRKLLRLYLSAYQSSLFDRVVGMRLASLERLWPGDLAYKHANGACFLVEDPALEQPRAERFEISPSGPLFGYKTKLATAQAGLLERSLLDNEGITADSFRLPAGLAMEGERRPLRVPLGATSCRVDGEGLVLDFVLPAGSFATTVLAEIMK
jgi:tRNA pseudouridine13 synthase